MATLLAVARHQFRLILKMGFIYYGFGWSFPKYRPGKTNRFAMFSRYSEQANAYKMSQMVPAFGLAANMAGFYDGRAGEVDRNDELDSGPEDLEEYVDDANGKVVRRIR